MNAPAAVLTRERKLVLKVFGGRLDGAEFALPPERRLTLGHRLDNDIVLRGAETRGCRIELRPDGECLRVKLIAGEAHLLGQPLEPDRSIVLPAFVPLALGEFRFAVGEDGHERWDEARELAQQLAVPDVQAPVGPEARLPVQEVQQRARWLSNYVPGWLYHPATLIAAALALAVLLALGPIRDFATQGMSGPDEARAALAAGGFNGVIVAQDPAGEFLVFSGTVRDDAQLAELRRLVAEDFPEARLYVDTSGALVRAATDILTAEGIDAEAQTASLGVVTVMSEYLPADRRVELENKLKSDLPALKSARFVLTGERGPDDLGYFFNSAKYGLAMYVDGDPGHLVTADGAYWFEGAMLPTGHEIVKVSGGRVTLRRNGLIEQLVVDPGLAPAPTPLKSDTAKPQGDDT